MTSNRPYMIRAIYEWIADNYLTPYIIVDADKKNVHVPRQYVKDGNIVFNISSGAIKNLEVTNKVIQFNARFSGVQMHVYAPIHAVLAIYAKENGRGLFFEAEEASDEGGDGEKELTPPPSGPKKLAQKKKPHLRVVK